jgi:hypothetical protein
MLAIHNKQHTKKKQPMVAVHGLHDSAPRKTAYRERVKIVKGNIVRTREEVTPPPPPPSPLLSNFMWHHHPEVTTWDEHTTMDALCLASAVAFVFVTGYLAGRSSVRRLVTPFAPATSTATTHEEEGITPSGGGAGDRAS